MDSNDLIFENGFAISKSDNISDNGFLIHNSFDASRASFNYDVGLDSAVFELKNVGGAYFLAKDGSVGIGNPTVSASLHVKGAGSTSATRAFKLENSSGGHLATFRNDGINVLGLVSGSAPLEGVFNTEVHSATAFKSGYFTYINDNTVTNIYGFKASSATSAGGAGGTVYGFNSSMSTVDAITYGGLFMATARSNARNTFGVTGIAQVNTGQTHTGSLNGGQFIAQTIGGTSIGNELVGLVAKANTTLPGETIATLIGADIEVSGVTGATIDDIVGLNVSVSNSGTTTNNMYAAILTGGSVGIGTAAPTSLLHLGASVSLKSSLRIDSGVAPTSPNDGDIWFDGTNIKMRIGGVTKIFTLV
jgi:hypothetical protein